MSWKDGINFAKPGNQVKNAKDMAKPVTMVNTQVQDAQPKTTRFVTIREGMYTQVSNLIEFETIDTDDSKNLSKIGYNEAQKIMMIAFKSFKPGAINSVYHYFNVPIQVWIDLLEAPSRGTAFSTLVKNAGFKYAKV